MRSSVESGYTKGASPNHFAQDNVIVTLRGGGGQGRDVNISMYHANMARNVQITLLGILVCSKESYLYNTCCSTGL